MSKKVDIQNVINSGVTVKGGYIVVTSHPPTPIVSSASWGTAVPNSQMTDKKSSNSPLHTVLNDK